MAPETSDTGRKMKMNESRKSAGTGLWVAFACFLSLAPLRLMAQPATRQPVTILTSAQIAQIMAKAREDIEKDRKTREAAIYRISRLIQAMHLQLASTNKTMPVDQRHRIVMAALRTIFSANPITAQGAATSTNIAYTPGATSWSDRKSTRLNSSH